MNNSPRFTRAAAVFIAAVLQTPSLVADGKSYDLETVEGMMHFGGSAGAKTLLEKNGFVVADPYFKQIFEPYIESKLPLFITTDSAWHTYHVLLEEGVKQMEEVQARRLKRFSQILLNAAGERAARGDGDFDEIAQYVSLGLAIQDAKHLASLTAAQKSAVEAIKDGTAQVQPPIGFPLSALNFRAASFYTQSAELANYFSARQWYASVVFRLQNERETRLALKLAMLINSRSDASNLWQQLSAPFDVLLARTEDGDVRTYADVAQKVLGPDFATNRIAAAQKELDVRIAAPRINDQLLSPEDYAQFDKVTKGFRLFPPRQLPCAVTFHHTTDPVIPKRMFPSGLDFLVASPTLRSPAAVRALELQSGKATAAVVQKFSCEPFPDSLHGEAMKLLALLQKTPPASAPTPLRTEAWADQQLWTQLGAWAEQRHTWALHTKLSVMFLGMSDTPTGVVAPYPEFFSGLASLSRRTAEALNQTGLAEPFDVTAVAREMASQIALWKEIKSREARFRPRNQAEWMKKAQGAEQFGAFFGKYFEKFGSELKEPREFEKLESKLISDLETLSRRVADGGKPSDAEAQTLKEFAASADNDVPTLLSEFASACDRLTALSRKSLANEKLTEEDQSWISSYGTLLAKFHFYEGNSYLSPRDDFAMVTRIFSNPLLSSVLYAGLGRPQALYVIVPNVGKQQLYRGAVMTYREFARDGTQPLDDDSWRKMVSGGLIPSPPAFTKSFYSEADAKELLKLIKTSPTPRGTEGDYEGSPQAEQAAELLGSRATAADLPELFALVRHVGSRDSDVAVRLIEIIGRLAGTNDIHSLIGLLAETAHSDEGWGSQSSIALAGVIEPLAWEPYQAELVRLLSHSKRDVASAAAAILGSRPKSLDVRLLVDDYDAQPSQARTRRLELLGKIGNSQKAQDTLLRGLQDPEDNGRMEAVRAIYKAKWSDARSLPALINRLNDTNWCVVATAAVVLGKFNATNAAPALLEKLKATRSAPAISDEEWSRQTHAVVERELEFARMDPDRDDLPGYFAEARVVRNMQRASLLRILRGNDFMASLVDREVTPMSAIIGALGDLNYKPAMEDLMKEVGGENNGAAVTALKKIAPAEVEQKLFSLALDSQADPTRRAAALNSICDLQLTNRVRDLLPLLDETALVMPTPRRPELAWHLCDHAAVVTAKLLDWEINPRLLGDPASRTELSKKLRDWAANKP